MDNARDAASRQAVEEIIRFCEQNMCWHCGRLPDADGDHSCPCPYSDTECPDHPPVSRPSDPTKET